MKGLSLQKDGSVKTDDNFLYIEDYLHLNNLEDLLKCGSLESLNYMSACMSGICMAVKHLKCDSCAPWSLKTTNAGCGDHLKMSLWLEMSFVFNSADNPSLLIVSQKAISFVKLFSVFLQKMNHRDALMHFPLLYFG